MKKICFVALFSFFLSSNVHAEITTKIQAQEFINQYCISLVNEFKQTLEAKNELKKNAEKAGEEDFAALIITGAVTVKNIDRFIDTYTKLCK